MSGEKKLSDANKLMAEATKQLAEHVEWLAEEIEKIPSDLGMVGAKALLVAQTSAIKLRVVRADQGDVSVVWEYPDELGAFLKSPTTPKHLRDTLAGGRIVSTEQPAFSVVRGPDGV